MAKLDQTWTVEVHHAGSALAAELHRHMGLSHRQAKGLIDARCVKVNGEMATSHGLRVEAGQTLSVAYDPELKYEPIHAPKGALDNAFKTLFEDQHLLFVDKPAGLLTVPAEQGGEPSLADAVADHYRRRGQKHAQIFIVHRLDRFTSGVLVFARTTEALHHLKKLFAMHKLQRTYRAILVGELPENQGTLKGHLIEHAKTLKMRVVDPKRKDTEGSQSAVTHYRVVERLPGHTVVEVELETGRRNQIRVQFADRGFPLLGDQVYGEESPLLDRQALHAETLGVRHPVTDQMITVTAPAPADFEAALKTLRARTRLVRATEGEKGEAPAPKVAKKPAFTPGSKPTDRAPRGNKREERPTKRPFRPREDPGDRPRSAKPGFRKPAPRRDDEDRPRREGAPRKFEDRPREGRPPKRFEEQGERPRAAKPGFRKPAPRRDDEDRPRRDGAPRKFDDRPREGRPPKRFEEQGERPRAAKPDFRKSAPRRDDEDRPRRDFSKGPRAERGAVTGPRGSARPQSAGRPSGKPAGKPGSKSSGPRKPFKKRG
ncbi:MAG: RluA family pseudouridine synthase [Acidobacteria bacterium]|nr:RluA family pseudouridine synthase [Acidobacteriota bacterium]